MRIGILGGSFNPVHSGHVKLAQEARNQLNLDKVIFVPSFLTPLKSENLLWSAKKRVRLLQKALVKESAFEISLCEIKRGGVSYTVDTLKYFKSQVSPKDVLYFITGADTSASFHRWKSFDKILKLCHFVVASRPGYSVQCLPRGVIYMPMDAEDISSTLIRRRLSSTPKIKLICQAADEKKAESIVVMDMTKTSSICSYFVVLSASSTVRVKAVVDSVEDELRKHDMRPAHKEGYAEALWILMDYGDVAVHAFHEEARGFYNLEKLWGDVPQKKFVPHVAHKGKN